jgi:ribulose bisphosphate carboxylase small subunit
MAQLRITFTDGKELTGEVTPLIEYLFEQHYKIGFHKAFRDLEQQTMVYWLAHEITKRSGEAVDAKFENFIATLKSVSVEDSDPLV